MRIVTYFPKPWTYAVRMLPSAHFRLRGILIVALWALVLPLVPPLALAGPAYAASSDHPSQDLPKIPKRCSEGSTYINPDVRPCEVNRWQPGRPTLVLWGDSHALQMMPAVKKAVAGRGVNLAMFSLGSCPPLKFDKARSNAEVTCKDFNADALDYVTDLRRRGKPVRVIFGALWQGYRNLHKGLFETKTLDRADYPGYVVEVARIFPNRAPALLRRLGRIGVGVDVIGQTATVPVKGLRKCSAGEKPFVCDLPRRKALPEERATTAWLDRVMRPLNQRARLIDPNTAYCNQQICRGRIKGIYTFFNDLHISATRAGTMKQHFLPSVRALRRQR